MYFQLIQWRREWVKRNKGAHNVNCCLTFFVDGRKKNQFSSRKWRREKLKQWTVWHKTKDVTPNGPNRCREKNKERKLKSFTFLFHGIVSGWQCWQHRVNRFWSTQITNSFQCKQSNCHTDDKNLNRSCHCRHSFGFLLFKIIKKSFTFHLEKHHTTSTNIKHSCIIHSNKKWQNNKTT